MVKRSADDVHAGAGPQVAAAHRDERVGRGEGLRCAAETAPPAERARSHAEIDERRTRGLAVGAASGRAELHDVRQVGERGGVQGEDGDVAGGNARPDQPLQR